MFGCDPEIYSTPIALIREHLSAADIADIEAGLSRHVQGSDRLYAIRDIAQAIRDLSGGRLGTLIHWRALGVDVLTGSGIADFRIPNLRQAVALSTQDELDAAVASIDWIDGEEQARVDTWLALSPYLVWKIVNDVEEWAMDEVRDSLFTMARRTDKGGSIAQRAADRFEQAIEGWAKTALAA